jgi:hypothetical protein
VSRIRIVASERPTAEARSAKLQPRRCISARTR